MYKLIAFDGDDTLWHNEPLFRQAHIELREMLGHYVAADQVDDRLYQAELANLSIYGYGVTGFTLSMIETAIELSDRKISAEDIHRLAEIGKSMLRAPTRIIDGAETVLKHYASKPDYKVVLITKGDLIAQQLKIDRSGFEDLFDGIEIVSEKDPLTYLFQRPQHILWSLRRVGLRSTFLMKSHGFMKWSTRPKSTTTSLSRSKPLPMSLM
mgnify:CR=1 FL=1